MASAAPCMVSSSFGSLVLPPPVIDANGKVMYAPDEVEGLTRPTAKIAVENIKVLLLLLCNAQL